MLKVSLLNFIRFAWTDSKNPVKLLRHIKDYFLIQVLKELSRRGALLDLLFVSRDGLVGEMMINDNESIGF